MAPGENVKNPPTPHTPGSELPFRQIDRYEIESFLGAGAMGQVYRAIHTVTKRVCALKILPDELSKQPSFVTRFHHEAQILARLNHPHIVQIYSGGEASGKLFLEMEYIDGGDLQKRLHAQAANSPTPQGLPEEEVRRMLDGVLSALEYAHGAGVVHRDLKPANILIQKDGAVKVSDFGLAAAAGMDFQRTVVRESMTLTKVTSMETVVSDPSGTSGGSSGSSSFAGTILYMSPEALRGEAPDPRDDLFSIGVIAYYLLTGKTPAVNYKPVSRARPGANKGWDTFITHCLEEERASRYQTAAVARHALPKSGKGALLPLLIGGGALMLLLGLGAVGAIWYFWPKIAALAGGGIHSETTPTNDRAGARTTTDSADPASSASAGADSATPATSPGTSSSSSSSAALDAIPGHDLTPVTPSRETAETSRPTPPEPRPQAIAFARPADITLGGEPLELEASSSSGLPVQFTVASGPAYIEGNRLTPTDTGAVTVRASQPGNSEYEPADAIVRSFRITRPKTPPVTAATSTDAAATPTSPGEAAATSTGNASRATGTVTTTAPGTTSDAGSSASSPREGATKSGPASLPATPASNVRPAPVILSAAEKAQLGESFGAVPIPTNATQARLREAIGYALVGRGWTITEKNNLKIVGYLRQGTSEATVTFLYSGTEIEIYSTGYRIDKDSGARKGPQSPKRWLGYLKQDVARNLNHASGLTE